MTNQTIVTQIQNEITRLERDLQNLEEKKKSLKTEIRNHKKALQLLDGGGAAERGGSDHEHAQ